MSIFARKVARAKWGECTSLSKDDIPADAVTADLKTKDNALSFWRCDSNADDDLKEAVLALAAAGDRIDRMDIAFIDESAFSDAGLRIEATPGKTPVETLRESHRDVTHLDLVRLGSVASLVASACRRNSVRRFDKTAVRACLEEAIQRGRVQREALHQDLVADLDRLSGLH